jgi:HUS1 checkpoint protein
MCNRSNSRSITHDIPVKVISTSKISLQDFTEPSVDRATLNIQLPPLKIIKNMIERMKCLSEYVCLEASDKGTLNFKIDSDAVSVCCYFRNLPAIAENPQQRQLTTPKPKESVVTLVDSCTVRLSLKRLHDFFNSLQFQPTKIVCYFLNQKYAHFCVIHEEDMVLQYLVSSVLS